VTLVLDPAHQATILDHARRAYPEECCGLLLGVREGERKRVLSVHPTVNAWEPDPDSELDRGDHSRGDRFRIDPRAMLAAQTSGRATGQIILGIYHSHPDHPAVPSECDRRQAWPDYAYLIVAVEGREVTDLRNWQLDDHQVFVPEPLVITDAAAGLLPSP
jgi:proteasome lid subunit RPN8/RPN11